MMEYYADVKNTEATSLSWYGNEDNKNETYHL